MDGFNAYKVMFNKRLTEELDKKFDERELKEIELALTYAEHFKHGTDGHHRLLLIAKLYRMLEEQYARAR